MTDSHYQILERFQAPTWITFYSLCNRNWIVRPLKFDDKYVLPSSMLGHKFIVSLQFSKAYYTRLVLVRLALLFCGL